MVCLWKSVHLVLLLVLIAKFSLHAGTLNRICHV